MKPVGLMTALVVALATTACFGETPEWSGPSQSLLSRGRLFSGQTWWTRFGEPVNSAALAEDSAVKGAEIGGPVPMHGDGYVYGPGSCDCSPPCIGHLWNGYFQNPLRCHPHHCRLRGCGTNACGCGDNACGCAPSCSTKAACGCAEPVTCTTSADCGCKPVCGSCKPFHLGRFRCFAAHWNSCDSCSAPIGCGCSTAVPTDMPGEPEAKPSILERPAPMPESALRLLPRVR